jgi:GT2 family glycosyltransferase/SAM-dependent methyltransferase/glycosyltransferase involved in cell wall biosynthesis
VTEPNASTDASTGRIIDWTGERCVPWAEDIQVVYEHYHRYALAGTFTAGQRVLDLASGEGYGVALLAATAAEVVGVDIDGPSVAHARQRYAALGNVRFEVGSVVDPELLADEPPFDVITCFEAVEHVTDQETLLAMAHARLAPGGLLLVSTPDVTVYTHQHGNDNPYHVRELTEPQFRALLGERFEHVVVLRQNIATGSVITAEDGVGAGSLAQSLRSGPDDGWRVEPGLAHTYLLAVASDREPTGLPAMAALLDPDLTLLRAAVERGERTAAQAEQVRAARDDLHRQLADRVTELAATAQARDRAEQAAADARADAEHSAGRLAAAEEVITELRAETDQLAAAQAEQRQRAELDAARRSWLAENTDRLAGQVAALAADNARLAQQSSAAFGRALTGYRRAIERYAPRGTTRRDAYERLLGRPAGVLAAGPELGPVAIPVSESPLVSVIIPVHGKWAYTRQCLDSIERSRPSVPFEVVVVDDASPDDSAARLAGCAGVRLVRAPRNLGFVRACNLGAEQARGELLVFLNNDTEVRAGWLDHLVDTVYQHERIGLVGARLVYPDGSLQESGGIVWSDGTGWNYGRGQSADNARYTSLRDVDYCSGAALLVRGDLFAELGGFDERYAPAYYEDTDLAFAVRAAGYRTVIQPAAVVVHHEGVSNGTDTAGTGLKRFQEINRTEFVRKWSDALTAQLDGPGPANLWLARQRTAAGHGGGIVLVVDHEVPTPDRDSGSVRMRRVLDQLLALDRRVVFFAANGAAAQPYTGHLEQAGVTVVHDWQQQAEFLREAGPALELVLLSRPNVAWQLLEQVRDCAPQALVGYDTVDLHFLRLSREAELADRLGRAERAAALRKRAEASRELELALIRSTDFTLVVSGVERDLLRDLAPAADVRVLSNVHTPVADADRGLAGRAEVLFVGSYNHVPNQDAMLWLAGEIMPLVRRQCPEAVLHLVGSNIPTEQQAFAGDGVVVHGWVEDLAARYAGARVAVAPLRFGAGVKGKVGESLSHGVPVVGTALAFEGMDLVADEHVLTGETAAELADAIVTLLTKDDLWHRLATAGRRCVATQFGPDVARTALRVLLDLAAAPRD